MGAWGGKKYEGLGSRNVNIWLSSNFHNLEGSKVYLFIKTLQIGRKFDSISIIDN